MNELAEILKDESQIHRGLVNYLWETYHHIDGMVLSEFPGLPGWVEELGFKQQDQLTTLMTERNFIEHLKAAIAQMEQYLDIEDEENGTLN